MKKLQEFESTCMSVSVKKVQSKHEGKIVPNCEMNGSEGGQGVFVLFINNLPTEWEEKTVGIYTMSRQILKCDVIQNGKRCKNKRLYPTTYLLPI